MSVEQTPDIETVAAVVAEHREAEVETVTQGWVTACDCGWTSEGELGGEPAWFAHLAEALAPVLAAAVREAEQRAWDEGFDAGERDVIDHQTDGDWSRECIPNPYRADRVAVDAPEGGA